MKIIITENQELKAKKKVIFFLLDKQKYNLIEINDNIYFVKKIGDEKAEIRYDKSNGSCYISYDLTTFLSSITGFERTEVQVLIGNWVEHTLQMEVKYNQSIDVFYGQMLNIPYKWR